MTKEAVKERILNELNRVEWSPKKVRSILRCLRQEKTNINPELSEVVFMASKATKTNLNDMMTGCRKRQSVIGRSLVYSYMREQGFTLTSIGSVFKKHHSTIIYCLDTLAADLEVGVQTTVDAERKFKELIHSKRL